MKKIIPLTDYNITLGLSDGLCGLGKLVIKMLRNQQTLIKNQNEMIEKWELDKKALKHFIKNKK